MKEDGPKLTLVQSVKNIPKILQITPEKTLEGTSNE